MKYVAAFDPGRTTGVAIASVEEDGSLLLRRCMEIPWVSHLDILQRIFSKCAPEFKVIIEDFRLYHGRGRDLVGSRFEPVQVIGAIRMLREIHGITEPLTMYPAAARKKVQVLQAHKVMVGGSPHKKDAYQHLRYWSVRMGLKLR